VLFVPRLFLAPALDVPAPVTSCVTGCPANPWFAFETEPAIVADVLRPAGALAVLAVATATALLLYRRSAGATSNLRRESAPLLGIAVLFVGIHAIGTFARDAIGSEGLESVSWILAFRFPVLALAFLVGLLRWRLFAARSLAQLARCLRESPSPQALRRAFADAYEDPGLEILYPVAHDPSAWRDAAGQPVDVDPGDGRGLTEVRRDGRVVAAIRHDPALLTDPELVAAGTAMAGVVLDNQRLAASTETAVRDVRRSRDRLAARVEQERRRIERDLHDGAQQRLVALRIELGLAEDLVERDPHAAVVRLHKLEREVDAALDDVRSLAHGVYPRVLADRGLAEALRVAARGVRLPVEVHAAGVPRYPAEVESAVYFCLLEALQNVLKHADGARRVIIELRDIGAVLRFSLRDDGAGVLGGHVVAGAGITNMRDRLTAVGGTVAVTSTPRVGTAVRGSVPVGA
jgi:signal transduction histidine kinase